MMFGSTQGHHNNPNMPKRGATTCDAIFIHYFQKHATEISKMDFLKLENLIPSMFGVVSMLSGNRLSKPEVFSSTTKDIWCLLESRKEQFQKERRETCFQ